MALIEDWPSDIHVIGMGGLGTHILQALLEQGAQTVHIWDDDVVEAHNLPTQFLYCKRDIGHKKVLAATEFVNDRGFNTEIIAHSERVTAQTRLSGIVLGGVDSMASRAAIWDAIKYDALVHLYIDFRIGEDDLQAFTVDPGKDTDVDWYTGWIMDDDVAPDLGCVTRENPHSALEAGPVVSAHLTLFMRGEPIERFLNKSLLSESRKRATPVGR